MGPAVTVVMITRDRRASTLRSLSRLQALPEQPPVIVVDNGSSDGTAEAVRALSDVTADVTVVQPGRNLGAAGRTLGVEAAATPYVAFSDDDSWWAPGALTRAAEMFDAAPRLGLLAGRTLVGPEQVDDPINALLAAAPLGQQSDLPGPTVMGFLACAAVVRREAYLAVGGFHRRFGVGGEEHLLALDLLAAGWGLCYAPEVVAHHHPKLGHPRSGRRISQARNDLWTAWLRRSPRAAAAATLALARRAPRDGEARAILGAAVRGLPWVLSERRSLPDRVERMARQLF